MCNSRIVYLQGTDTLGKAQTGQDSADLSDFVSQYLYAKQLESYLR